MIIPQQVYEVQDYLTTWHGSYDPIFLGVSKERWDAFDAETQDAMRAAAQEAMAYQREITREGTANGAVGAFCHVADRIRVRSGGSLIATAVAKDVLLAIPFFILAGKLMGSLGIAERMIQFFRVLIGKLPGGMGVVGTVVCLFWGAVLGSGPASVAAIVTRCHAVATTIRTGLLRGYAEVRLYTLQLPQPAFSSKTLPL